MNEMLKLLDNLIAKNKDLRDEVTKHIEFLQHQRDVIESERDEQLQIQYEKEAK